MSTSVVLLILSGLATLHSPGLRLPTSSDLQLFTSSHPFERYDMEFKHKFGFERDMEPENEVNMPLRFVFGTVARDTGSYLDPGDRGVLALDPNFDMSSKEAQSWMFKFCNSLKKQSWYKYTRGDLQLSNCFIITFKEFMYRPCYNDLSKENHRPCCRESAFPFEPAIFNECLLAAVDELYETPSFLWLPGVAGPKFNIETKRVSAVVVEYEAGLHFSYNYEAMDEFYREVETWFQSILKEAPLGLRNGFFVSYLGQAVRHKKSYFCAILFFKCLTQFEIASHGFELQSSMTCSRACCTAPTLQSVWPWPPASWLFVSPPGAWA